MYNIKYEWYKSVQSIVFLSEMKTAEVPDIFFLIVCMFEIIHLTLAIFSMIFQESSRCNAIIITLTVFLHQRFIMKAFVQ